MTVTRPLNVAATLLNGTRVPGKTGIGHLPTLLSRISKTENKREVSLGSQSMAYTGTSKIIMIKRHLDSGRTSKK